MRSCCAIYLDAGYLLASAATRVTGTSLRGGVQVDHQRLITAVTEQVQADSSLPLLRVNWYDSGAGPGGTPDRLQEQIGMLPRVKLRLGRLNSYGEQKGVDLRIGLDLVTHARNGVVDKMYLVSGDDDLTEAVEEAQANGTEVVVLAVSNPDGRPHGVSRHLQRAADELVLIDDGIVVATVKPRTEPRQPEHVPVVSPVDPVPGEAEQEPTVLRPTPALLAARSAPRPAALAASASATVQPASGLVYRSDSGDGRLAGINGLPDPGVTGDPVAEEVVAEVCAGVLETWLRRATDHDVASLRQGRPFIPGEIDRALLMDLSARADVFDLHESTRYQLRHQFWIRVDAQGLDGSSGPTAGHAAV